MRKWKPKAIECIFVGYAKGHAADTYRFHNPLTRRIILSRNVQWGQWIRPDPLKSLKEEDIYDEDVNFQVTPGIDEGIIQPVGDPKQPSHPDNAPSPIPDPTKQPPLQNITINPNLDPLLTTGRILEKKVRSDESTIPEPNINTPNQIQIQIQVHDHKSPKNIEVISEDDEETQKITNTNTMNEKKKCVVNNDQEEREWTPFDIITDSDREEEVVFKDQEGRDELDELNQSRNEDESSDSSKTEEIGYRTRSKNRIMQDREVQIRTNKLKNAMKKLDTNFNPLARETIDKVGIEHNRGLISNQVHFLFRTALSSDPCEPKTVQEAFNGTDATKWRKALASEFMNFIKRKSWKKVKREMVRKQNRKLVGTKIVFKIKDEQDGSKRYKCRAVTKGYAQIPGVDYTESFSPVATDVSIRMLMGIALYNMQNGKDWNIHMIDIEAAFLEGEMDMDMYIEWPEGMLELGFITQEEHNGYCIKLEKSMYGNVDAALKYFKVYSKYLREEMKMIQSETDPCIFFIKNEQSETELIAAIYVDDTMLVGTNEKIEWFKRSINRRFNYSDLGKLKKHLGIWYEWGEDQDSKYIRGTMPKLIKEIINKTEQILNKELTRERSTPATPGKTLKKAEESDEEINPEEYRSIVGKLMYLSQKIYAEGANSTRDLAKHFNKPSEEHWKALEHAVGYLKNNMDDVCITYRPPRDMRLMHTADSGFGTETENRKSITGMEGTLEEQLYHGVHRLKRQLLYQAQKLNM